MLGAERINACMVGNSLKKLVRQAVECSKLAIGSMNKEYDYTSCI